MPFIHTALNAQEVYPVMKSMFPCWRRVEIRFMSLGIDALTTSTIFIWGLVLSNIVVFFSNTRTTISHCKYHERTPCLCSEYFFPQPVKRARFKLFRVRILYFFWGKREENYFIFRPIANILFARSRNDMNISWNHLCNEHSKRISLHLMTWGRTRKRGGTVCCSHQAWLSK